MYAASQQEPRRATVLIYGHYDVQPPDPLREWHAPPFEPVIRGNYIFGRGSCDDKGQMFAHVKAVESYLRTQGKLPVNVKCLFEGEEEIGCPQLKRFLVRNRVPFLRRCGGHVRYADSCAQSAGHYLCVARWAEPGT